MACQNIGVFLLMLFNICCLGHLVKGRQISRPVNEIQTSVDQQTVNFECPIIHQCPRCPDLQQCPNCPQCPDPSTWLRFLECPEETRCPEATRSPGMCPEIASCPEVTPCPPAPEPAECTRQTQHPETITSPELSLVKRLPLVLDSEGWIVFQRRVNGEVDFYRGWEEYKKGFGNFEDGDFWLGNEIIYQLTSNGEWELRVDIAVQLKYIANLDYSLNNGKVHTFYALYSNFSLSGEDDNYRLTLGGYSGTAGDSLAWYHNGMEFSTRDRDNDKYAYGHCARTGHGAWWYNKCNYSNLNGLWGNNTDGRGLRWSTRTYSQTSKSTLMKMRPVS